GNRENNGLAAGTCLRGLIALGDQRLAQYFNRRLFGVDDQDPLAVGAGVGGGVSRIAGSERVHDRSMTVRAEMPCGSRHRGLGAFPRERPAMLSRRASI